MNLRHFSMLFFVQKRNEIQFKYLSTTELVEASA